MRRSPSYRRWLKSAAVFGLIWLPRIAPLNVQSRCIERLDWMRTLMFVVNELGRGCAIPGQKPGAARWSDCAGPAAEPSRRRLSKL